MSTPTRTSVSNSDEVSERVSERMREEEKKNTSEGVSERVSEEETLKEHRRSELLAIARKSRLRWILQAREKTFDYSPTSVSSTVSGGVSKGVSEGVSGAVSTSSSKFTTVSNKTEFYRKVPAAACLQEVVDFLVDMTMSDGVSECESDGVSGDMEYIDIESLAPSDTLDDELLEVSLEDLQNYDQVSKGLSELTLSPYSIFLEKLKHSSSIDIVNMLRKFVTRIQVHVRDNDYISHHVTIKPTVVGTTTTVSSSAASAQKLDIAQEIFSFMTQVEQSLRQHALWSSESQVQFKETMDSLEKFLFHKLHPCLFPQVTKKNVDKDDVLRERISSLAFLDPEHLDMVPLKKNPPSREEQFLKLKRKLKIKENELVNANNIDMKTMNVNMMNVHTEGLAEAVYLLKYYLPTECFSPSDMMKCLRDVSQSVIETISVNQISKKKPASRTPPSSAATSSPNKSNKDLPGADDLLPALILAIKEANPPHFYSTINYLETYLSPKKLFSEAGYILTQFVSAVQFLEHVNANALTISPMEFEESMYKCK